ncbi:hypothetical protein ES689_06220 [Frigoribacterium sp. ACAM 257]|uniref:hypothetical protein n=1 Tax=Frigoribacterium sp. ACAM 257 TaxID=2508998 RepID=UPI0011B9678B|nr:hypothetical protein [Frigoribacterium sp. ACAM 257]TWX40979.1 hypothetical protein ES689_06220 [Frigoribacterium sp. ACAM 257]
MTTIDVDLDALRAMAAAAGDVGEGLTFSHVLTGDCSAALGSGDVAEVLREVSVHLARRCELALDLAGRLATLPREFAEGVRAADAALAAKVADAGKGDGGAAR